MEDIKIEIENESYVVQVVPCLNCENDVYWRHLKNEFIDDFDILCPSCKLLSFEEKIKYTLTIKLIELVDELELQKEEYDIFLKAFSNVCEIASVGIEKQDIPDIFLP
jgi:hypothetical protein